MPTITFDEVPEGLVPGSTGMMTARTPQQTTMVFGRQDGSFNKVDVMAADSFQLSIGMFSGLDGKVIIQVAQSYADTGLFTAFTADEAEEMADQLKVIAKEARLIQTKVDAGDHSGMYKIESD